MDVQFVTSVAPILRMALRDPCPQASTEFEVADVAAAAAELAAKGRLIHGARTEPWGQITARLLSPEGLLVAVGYSPAFQDG